MVASDDGITGDGRIPEPVGGDGALKVLIVSSLLGSLHGGIAVLERVRVIPLVQGA